MIKSINHALQVQVRRLQSKRTGMAKAVYRFLHKHNDENFKYARQALMREAWKFVVLPEEPEGEDTDVQHD